LPKNQGDRQRQEVPVIGVILTMILVVAPFASAQHRIDTGYYARLNTFGVFSAYSNDSSHMLLGEAENRKLFFLGGSYSRRLVINRFVNWQYNGELMPLVLESDPTDHITVTWNTPTPPLPPIDQTVVAYTSCHSSSGTDTLTVNGVAYAVNYSNQCGRRWTAGEAMSPVGLQLNFFPRDKMQVLLIGHGGYMYSTRAVPVEAAGSFNFTFDGGIGVEFYRSRTNSIRADYRYHHFSNKNTATANPGVDNGMFQVTYSFGR
jgi:opacity protein-like surface antigen